jgi:hypothetical protein
VEAHENPELKWSAGNTHTKLANYLANAKRLAKRKKARTEFNRTGVPPLLPQITSPPKKKSAARRISTPPPKKKKCVEPTDPDEDEDEDEDGDDPGVIDNTQVLEEDIEGETEDDEKEEEVMQFTAGAFFDFL